MQVGSCLSAAAWVSVGVGVKGGDLIHSGGAESGGHGGMTMDFGSM